MAQYLDCYAAPEVKLLEPLKFDAWDEAIVIPCLGENETVIETLQSVHQAAFTGAKKAIAILVVNSSAQSSIQYIDENDRLLKHLSISLKKRVSGAPPISLGPYSDWLDLMVIDRTSPGFRFDEKEGVGLARKIGCDIALQLKAYGSIRSDWIHTTDADARLDTDYFDVPKTLPSVVALIHPFRHIGLDTDDIDGQALSLYEVSLRYYVLGLRFAGSPYAFHTIGSTLSFKANAYATVRGFPRREAAEDFYILEKLAKVGQIQTLQNAGLSLIQRPSLRVPFGTGAGTHKIAGQLRRGEGFCLYHPQSFVELKKVLVALENLVIHQNLDRMRKELSKETNSILDGMQGAFQVALATRKTAQTLRDHLHSSFDALKTLKFIHALRDRWLPNVPYKEALQEAAFFKHKGTVQSLLFELRNLDR